MVLLLALVWMGMMSHDANAGIKPLGGMNGKSQILAHMNATRACHILSKKRNATRNHRVRQTLRRKRYKPMAETDPPAALKGNNGRKEMDNN